MGARTNVAGATDYVLQEAINAYADEAYTTAKKLSGTGIVGTNPQIDTSTETYVGQVRWNKPITSVINVASLTNAAVGTQSNYAQDFLTYVKTVRTNGTSKVNLKEVVTQTDGLAKFGRDFAEIRGQDEHNAILAVLKGVALSEVLNGAAAASGATGLGGQTFDNAPEDNKYGFYIDLGAAAPIVAATTAIQGAARAEGFLQAIGMAWKDYEPEYAYLVTSPEIMASLRSANLVDDQGVVEGNINFSTIFGGKFRLIQTRAAQGFSTAELAKINTGVGVDIIGTKTSFIVLPGAIAMENLMIPEPIEIQRVAGSYNGGGSTEIWNRWGYVACPAGYNWAGSADAFPTDADYMKAVEGGVPTALTSVASVTLAATTGSWLRKSSSALNLGILPVFHS
jgi:hypothetical protein